MRLPVRLDQSAHRIRLEAIPAGFPLAEGQACLTAHSHAGDFTWQQNFQVRGDLTELEDGDWALVPRRLVGGFELPKGLLARNRAFLSGHWRFYKTAKARTSSKR